MRRSPLAWLQPLTPAAGHPVCPPPTGGSSALKIILIIVAVIVVLGILGMASVRLLHLPRRQECSRHPGRRPRESRKLPSARSKPPRTRRKPPKISVSTSIPERRCRRTAPPPSRSEACTRVTASFESSDSVDKVCDFYKSKFPNATVTTFRPKSLHHRLQRSEKHDHHQRRTQRRQLQIPNHQRKQEAGVVQLM